MNRIAETNPRGGWSEHEETKQVVGTVPPGPSLTCLSSLRSDGGHCVESETVARDVMLKGKNKQSTKRPVRKHQVKVMLDDEELKRMDSKRGKRSRAVMLRSLLLDKFPAPVPEVNIIAWTELSRASANLNQLARHLNTGGVFEVEQVKATLERFRAALIAAAK